MPSTASLLLGGLAATYLFLRVLLRLTQNERELPAILTDIPFVQPLVGMIREKSRFHLRLRDAYPLPIYTLRLPFQRIYIINATELIPALQKQWRVVSFASIAADAGTVVGMSRDAVAVMKRDLTSEHGFSLSWPRYIMPAMAPGPELDAINRRAIEVYVDEMERLRSAAAQNPVRVGFWEWTRNIMVQSTAEAVWGPENPYRDPAVAEAWKTFEAGFLTFSMFPFASVFFPELHRAREVAAAAMIDYMRGGGYKTASGLVRKRVEHHADLFGLSLDDIGRGELGNTAPCAWWVLYHIFSDPQVLGDIRKEVSALIVKHPDPANPGDSEREYTIDLARLKDKNACPILQSTLQETLRHRAVNPGRRVLLEDVQLPTDTPQGPILLKKGAMLMIPAVVQHTSTAAWGADAGSFNHLRFVPESSTTSATGDTKAQQKKQRPNHTAFRAFGGGHVLCPGRHFATMEILALAALLVLYFDIVPVRTQEGKWTEPTWENSPAQAGFPVIDQDIVVEMRPREDRAFRGKMLRVVYSGSDKAMGIVSEDIEAAEREVM